MFASSRIRGFVAPALAVAALLMALPGCEEDTKPTITRMSATPLCDEIKTVTEVILDDDTNEIVRIDTLGVWMEVSFFARASSGNELSDPTGANSPLEWTWNFGDGSAAVKNLVSPTHRYEVADEYEVRLTVKDDDGDEDTKTLTIRVGEAYSDLDILETGFEPEHELVFSTIPESVAIDLSGAWGTQYEIDGMDMIFDGSLQTICEISGLFEQYLWQWTVIQPPSTDSLIVNNVNPAVLEYEESYLELQTSLRILETVTGIERFYPEPDPPSDPPPLATSYNPVGVRIGRTVPRTTIPDLPDSLALVGYLLKDVEEMTFELEWDGGAAALDTVLFDPAISPGFTATSTRMDMDRVAISLTSAGGYTGTEITTPIAAVVFTPKDVEPGIYPVRVRDPWAMRTYDTESGALITTVDGEIALDTDCDEDGTADSFQAEFFPDLYDCNGNGIHDACDIADGTSEDQNQNGIPDECED